MPTTTELTLMHECLVRTKASSRAISIIMSRMTTLSAIARFAEALLASPRMSEAEMLALSASIAA